MPSLNADESAVVKGSLPGHCTVKCQTVAKLYMADGSGGWGYTGILGALIVFADEQKKTYFMAIRDIRSGSELWEQELYQGFQYAAPTPFFHIFETDDYVAGLSFADEVEAKEFFGKILFCKNTPVKPAAAAAPPRPAAAPPVSAPPAAAPPSPAPTPAPAPSPAPTPAAAPAASKPAPAPAAAPKEQKKPKKKGFFSKMKELFVGEDDAPEIVLSGPRNFRHESHIGWDPEKGFDIRNIPPQWKQLFQAAGVKKSELRNPETSKFVMNVISDFAVASGQSPDDAVASAGAPSPGAGPGYAEAGPSAPPPPPPAGGGAPPPPPPPPPPGPGGPPAPRPPPASTGAPAPPAAPPAPAPADGRGDLLAQIRTGTSLRKVDPNDPLPNLDRMDAKQTKSLADTLASAMASRRQDVGDEGEDEEEEAWSD